MQVGINKVRNLKKKRSHGVAWYKEQLQMISMALPVVLLVFVFNYLPMGGLIIAFKDFRIDLGIFGSNFIGFDNFQFFFQSSDAYRVIRNTLCYNAVFILLGLIVPVTLAIMLLQIQNRIGIRFYQTTMFLPHLLSWVVVAYMSMVFFNFGNGVFNQIVKMTGGEPISWYSEPKYWPFILTAFQVWKTAGYSSIVYYATGLGIDASLYEAAKIDGCSNFKTIFHITLPGLKSTMIILTILAVGRIFYADFGLFFQLPMDSGTLMGVTDVVDTYIFRTLRVTGDIGISAAVGMVQSIVGFILVMATNLIVKKIDSDSALI